MYVYIYIYIHNHLSDADTASFRTKIMDSGGFDSSSWKYHCINICFFIIVCINTVFIIIIRLSFCNCKIIAKSGSNIIESISLSGGTLMSIVSENYEADYQDSTSRHTIIRCYVMLYYSI